MKILFMGTPCFAKIVLEKILEDSTHQIIGLFSQPDRPFGRKQELKFPDTKEFLIQRKEKIPIFQPEVLDEKCVDIISSLSPDVILVVAYGKILPKKILSLSKCINIHASILPKYRGASPIQEMILNDDSEYGVSVINMEESLDSGDILGVHSFEVKEYMDIDSLSRVLAQMGADLVLRILQNLSHIQPIRQIHSESSYCKKILKEDGLIDFGDAKKIFLKSLAYASWPNIFLKNGLKFFGINLVDEDGSFSPGEILEIRKNTIVVGCKKGIIEITTLQAPGKQKISASAYVRGKRFEIGHILK
ncbi:methionyl-tRNA formyltransferase [Helicobacter cappadocius]|uniref:Methionyl-tRNA formyltransferase n=1 Tax=Helicobacter cappadocius TaxID=3063998 RepID=A0AA90TBA4_9HELI|nr:MULTISPECIES: methionyl-tRNA formyltransferase [unclassified Helicobacter]MDO7252743.1 methionyl-tRNA formyltransferase [Helicobacter sp. faydin-H75]MDP2538611.1 methionyl-tRNA formyltransferase [Helicobacter sp. faydin-H76]